ncbi:DUF7507 domain-containing protein [Microbacterium resistens]
MTAMVLVATAAVAGGALAAAPAQAQPGNPGTPSDPSVAFDEDFENGVGATAISLADYQDDTGVRYESDPYWVRTDQCNGAVLQYDGTVFPSGYCTTGNASQANVRRLADVLGQVNAGVQGSSDPAQPVNGSTAETRTNHAVTAWTGAVDGPSNAIVFESSPLNLQEQDSRFFTASIDVAEVSCTYRGGQNNSRLNFFLVSEGQELPLNSSPIRACTDDGVSYYTSPDLGGWGSGGGYVAAGHYFSDGSYLVSADDADDMVFRMRNLTGSSAGNDFAYDNARLVDATPQLDKSFSPTSVPTGGVSTLTLTVTNTSDLAAKKGWSFTDTLPDGLVIADPANVGGTCAADVMAPAGGAAVEVANGELAKGESSCTVTVDVTSETPRGSDPSPKPYENCAENITAHVGLDLPGCATVEFYSEPALVVEKESTGDDTSRVGDTVSYEVDGTNSGTADYTDANPAVVFDDLSDVLDDGDLVEGSLKATIDGQDVDPPTLNGSLLAWDGALPAGKRVVISYDVILKDGGDKNVANVAFPSDTPYDPDNPPTTPSCDDDRASCTILPLPGIALEKSADKEELVVGETVTYSFTVTNVGRQALDDVRVEEGQFTGSGEMSAVTCPETSLQPGDSTTCTATYTVTQADVDRGSVENSATSTGNPPRGPAVISNPSEASIPQDPNPSLVLTKSADKTELVAGETVTYSFVVTNTGNVTLTDVGVEEGDFTGSGELSAIDCPEGAASLAPGESVTCTATYVVTQADVDRGAIENSATATGTSPTGDPVTSVPSDVTIPQDPNPSLVLTKSADKTELVAGETITYSFVVTNTGNVTLTDVVVEEGDFTGSGEMSAVDCPEGAASLAPGESVTCTATYVVTQADVDRGSVENRATATGTPPTGDPVTSVPSDVTVPADAQPGISLMKSADKTELVAGEAVTYSFVVTNTGNVTLTDVVVEEDDFTGSGELSEITCPEEAASLAPGESVTCTATYVVTQADVDRGAIENSATATGTPPTGDPVTSGPSDVTVPADAQPGISLVKSADKTELVAGEEITYSFTVTNTGNVTLTDVTVDEANFSGSGELSEMTCPEEAASLAPGESVTCTATYVVTQADVDRGSVENRATATGTPPTGDPVTSVPSDVTVPADAQPGISLMKSADKTELVAGEAVTYSFVVTNTGNVTLTDVGVEEGDFSGSEELSEITCPEEAASLAPGDQITCSATYVVTQADVDRGSIENSATATGTSPSGDPVTSDPSDVTVPADAQPSLALVKSSDTDTITTLGQTITYSFTVTNTGNVTVTDVTVEEGDFSGSGELSEITCPDDASSLAPGASVTCTATYETTQADVDAGGITNTASSTGTSPSGEPVVSAPSDVTIPAASEPDLTLVKSADKTELVVGETVIYSFIVTNTGNTTLTDVVVDEGDFSGSGALSEITCPDGAASLAPGEQVTCTATYTVTQADVDAGALTNSAIATGTPPGGGDPVSSAPSGVSIPQDPHPGLALVKSADRTKVTKAGEVITYSFRLTNTGNVTLTNVGVEEGDFTGHGVLSAVICPDEAAMLLPGQSIVCTATYTVQQEDLTGAALKNVATGTGEVAGSNPAPVSSPPSAWSVGTPASADDPDVDLPRTGGEISSGLLALAGLLFAVGITAVVSARRRASGQAG